MSFDEEEELLQAEFHDGDLSLAEYNEAMRDLARDYRAEAEESAQGAYDAEMDRW